MTEQQTKEEQMERKAELEELEATADAFFNEIREHIEGGDIDTAQTLIKGASMGLAMAEDADGELREAFGMALAGLTGQVLNNDAQPNAMKEE